MYHYDDRSGELVGERMAFERRDTWDIKWSRDDPELLALMSKTRMYTFRGLEPEEPVVSMGHICDFNDLQIRACLLDEVMKSAWPWACARALRRRGPARKSVRVRPHHALGPCVSLAPESTH